MDEQDKRFFQNDFIVRYRFFIIPLILSLFLHLCALFFVHFQKKISLFSDSKEEKKETKLTLQLKDRPKQKQQMVDVLAHSNKKRPQDARYFSQNNNTVSKETKAAQIGKAYSQKDQGDELHETKKLASSKQLNKKIEKSQKDKILDKLKIGTLHENQMAQMAQESGKDKTETNVRYGQNDFLEDVEIGDVTALNTQENIYYGFYYRIRQQIEQNWSAVLQDAARSLMLGQKNIERNRNYITYLVILLDSKGKILQLKIKGKSGQKDFDKAAIEAFNRAGPFPNPPRALLINGVATLEWGMVVQT